MNYDQKLAYLVAFQKEYDAIYAQVHACLEQEKFKTLDPQAVLIELGMKLVDWCQPGALICSNDVTCALEQALADLVSKPVVPKVCVPKKEEKTLGMRQVLLTLFVSLNYKELVRAIGYKLNSFPSLIGSTQAEEVINELFLKWCDVKRSKVEFDIGKYKLGYVVSSSGNMIIDELKKRHKESDEAGSEYVESLGEESVVDKKYIYRSVFKAEYYDLDFVLDKNYPEKMGELCRHVLACVVLDDKFIDVYFNARKDIVDLYFFRSDGGCVENMRYFLCSEFGFFGEASLRDVVINERNMREVCANRFNHEQMSELRSLFDTAVSDTLKEMVAAFSDDSELRYDVLKINIKKYIVDIQALKNTFGEKRISKLQVGVGVDMDFIYEKVRCWFSDPNDDRAIIYVMYYLMNFTALEIEAALGIKASRVRENARYIRKHFDARP